VSEFVISGLVKCRAELAGDIERTHDSFAKWSQQAPNTATDAGINKRMLDQMPEYSVVPDTMLVCVCSLDVRPPAKVKFASAKVSRCSRISGSIEELASRRPPESCRCFQVQV